MPRLARKVAAVLAKSAPSLVFTPGLSMNRLLEMACRWPSVTPMAERANGLKVRPILRRKTLPKTSTPCVLLSR
jgi:hypothetical protein